VIAALALLSMSQSLAADAEKAAPAEPSPEVRQQMAAVHQRMSDCLKSDRPIAECRAEMQKNCREIMGERGCPMMGSGRGGMGPGMMGGGTSGAEPASEQPKN